MDDAIVGKLRGIVLSHGVEVCEDVRRVENLLRDLSGEHRREISLIVGAAREGIPAELLATRNGTFPGVPGERLVRTLEDNLGLATDAARWAVRSWAAALDIAGLDTLAAEPLASVPAYCVPSRQSSIRSVSAPDPAEARRRTELLTSKAMVIATAIAGQDSKARALAGLATVLAHFHPDQAEHLLDEIELLIESVTGESNRTRVLHAVATRIAIIDPDRAESLVQSIQHECLLKDDALACLARALVDSDPDRALRLAWSMTDAHLRATALTGIARTLKVTDRDRAARLLADVERSVQQLASDLDKVLVFVDIATAWGEEW